MSDGTRLTLAAVAALAVAGGLRRRGSRSNGPSLSRKDRVALRALRQALGISDVRVSQTTIYLVSAPKLLEGLLTVHDPETGRLLRSSAWKLEALLRAAKVHPGTIRSYVANANHWYGLYQLIRLFMVEVTGDEEHWRVQVVPSPGSPQEITWSAKTGKLVKPSKVESFRFCDAGPVVRMGRANDPALVKLHKNLPPIFVSHAVALNDLKAIDQCGGFLWPSFAVTWRVPASFGDVVFLAPATVIPRSMERRRSPFYLAPTDIWSPTARDLAKTQAQITAQLRGQTERIHQNDLLISSSGKPSWENLVGHWSYVNAQDIAKTERLTKKADLVNALWGMLDDHTVDDDPYAYPPRPDWLANVDYRYPYAELKTIGVVPVRNMVACFYPRRNARRIHTFLDRQGFGGFRVSFGWKGLARQDYSKGTEAHEAERRQWALSVTRAILAWVAKPCSGRNVKMGDQVSSPNLSHGDYRAMRDWTGRGASRLSHNPGLCGRKR